jgi:lysozyme family protein
LKGTKYGIAAHVYPHLDIKNLTLADATEIYRRDYAAKIAYAVQPAGVDHTCLDIAINAGPARAIKLQAAALGAAGTSALELARQAEATADKVALIKDVNGRMLSFYRSLSTFAIYGKGWSRRNAEREAISVKWALEAQGAPAAQVGRTLEQEGGTAGKTAKQQGAAAGGAATGGGATGTQVDPGTLDFIDWTALVGGGLMIAALIAFLVWHAWKNRARMTAYLDAARGVIG